MTVCPYGNEKYIGHPTYSYTSAAPGGTRQRLGSPVHQIEDGSEPGNIREKFRDKFRKTKTECVCGLSRLGRKSDRTFVFEIPFLIFCRAGTRKGDILFKVLGLGRSVQERAVQKTKTSSVFRTARKTRASSLGRPEAPGGGARTRVSAPSPSSTRAVLASFPGAREEMSGNDGDDPRPRRDDPWSQVEDIRGDAHYVALIGRDATAAEIKSMPSRRARASSG